MSGDSFDQDHIYLAQNLGVKNIDQSLDSKLIHARSRSVYFMVFMSGIYIVSNMYSAISASFLGYFNGGDFDGFYVDYNVVLSCLVLVVFCYVIFCYWSIRSILNNGWSYGVRGSELSFVGWFVLFAQLILLWFVVVDGALVTGNSGQASFATYFNALMVPDYLFTVYYVVGRGCRSILPNTIVYIASSLFRGQLGGVVVVIFIELLFIFYHGLWRRLKWVLLTVPCIPFFYQMRLAVRSGISKSVDDLVWHALDRAYVPSEILSAYGDIFHFLMMRLQHLSSVVLMAQNINNFAYVDVRGLISPFFAEGSLQRQLFRSWVEAGHSLQEFIMLNFFSDALGSWYIQPGLAGWAVVNPFTFVFVILYVVFLIVVLKYIFRVIGGDNFALTSVYVYALIFLVNGWFGPFNFMIHAALIMLLIKILIRQFLKLYRNLVFDIKKGVV